MKKKLVVAGGGHAHMMLLARIDDFVKNGCEVTVVGPAEHHYYSGMGPGLLGGTYRPEEIRFATRLVTEKMGGRFVLAKVRSIDPDGQHVSLDNGEQIPYDYLSCNLGSQVPKEMVSGPLDDIFLVKPIERLLEAQRRILELGAKKTLRIGVVGGGPSAVEIAGNIRQLGRTPGMRPPEVNVFAGRKLMPDHPEGVRQRAIRSLQQRHIAILEGTRIESVQTGRLTSADGTIHECDLIFVAVGVRPSRVFGDSGLDCGPDGGLTVNRYLHALHYANIFGGGDCVYFADQPLDKVGVYAVRQNPVLVHNLLASVTDQPLQPFAPGGSYLLIFNLGDRSGILYKWSLLFGGRLAFMIKDYIDRKFMRTFQALESA
jgi:NADH dehydrogenase FAD-containing subunit